MRRIGNFVKKHGLTAAFAIIIPGGELIYVYKFLRRRYGK
jgi:hypothetical protein